MTEKLKQKKTVHRFKRVSKENLMIVLICSKYVDRERERKKKKKQKYC